MTAVLKAELTFAAVPAGGTAALPHGLNLNKQISTIPDVVAFENPLFDFVSCTSTTITVVNNGLVAATTRVLLEFWHSYERALGQPLGVAFFQQFANPPFVIRGAGSAAGVPTQVFTYICTGAEGSDFFIPLPAARPNDNYIPQVTCGGVAAIGVADCPDLAAPDRTTVHFRVITTAAVQLNDRLDCVVSQRT